MAPPENEKVLVKHRYISTACFHDLHGNCPQKCTWCPTPCLCECHDAEEQRAYLAASNRYNRYMEGDTNDPSV